MARGGHNPQTKFVPQVFFLRRSSKKWAPWTQIERQQCGNTTENIDYFDIYICLRTHLQITHIVIASNWLFLKCSGDPLAFLLDKLFFRYILQTMGNRLLSSDSTDSWRCFCLRRDNVLQVDHAFLGNLNVKAGRGYHMVDLHAFSNILREIIVLMEFFASKDVSMLLQGPIEERYSEFFSFQTLYSWIFSHTITFRSYQLPLKFIKFLYYQGN